MAAGAGNPQLKLQVSLDLAFLRSQLSTISSQLGGQPLQLNAKINREAINKELNLISAQFRRRSYRLDINDTSLKTARINAQKLKNTLDLLAKTKYVVDVEYRQKGGPGKFSQGPLGAAGLEEYMRSQGLSGGGGFVGVGRSERLRKALNDLTVEQLKNIAKSEGITGTSRLRRDPLIDKLTQELSQTAAENILGNIKNQMQGAGKSPINRTFLDQIARAVFYMAGVDPAAIRAQQSARLAPPSINWPSVRPGVQPSNIPSSMALPPGRTYEALPGTSYSTQRRLAGDILSPSLKAAVQGAANAFADAVKAELNAAIRAVRVRDLGNKARLALSPSSIAGFLPPAAGRAPQRYSGRAGDFPSWAERAATREVQARIRSALRGIDVLSEIGNAGRVPATYREAYRTARPLSAIVPYAPGGAMVPTGGGGGGGRPPGGGGNFAAAGMPPGGGGGPLNFLGKVNLPGAGTIRELADEFGNATKQVLLFGTAYKALAFITAFPGQVLQAAASLQSYENSLEAVTGSTKEFEKSNQFILGLADKYNVPLAAARQGFVKLYASMAPAGFSGDEIRGLFKSISQAAATFGMSADKVDRVTYAFAQMASKGQVMSEELKGQLGDVLPGAMAIFAEAAGFKGPKAISQFSKALEDGVFKGDAMVALLKNVRVVMEKEFGPGATGAALTLQGALNRLANSTLLLYEAFEPIAVQFANAVVTPLTNGLQTITDGFAAFFGAQAAQTQGGSALARQLNELKPSFEGILANIKALLPSLQLFGTLVLNVAKFLTTLAGNPIVGFLAQVYTNILLVNTAFNLLGGKVLITLISSISATIARMVSMTVTMNALGIASTRAGASIAGTQLQMLLLQRSAAGAVGPISALLTSLLRMAAIGAIAIIVTIVVNGLTQLSEAQARIDRLRGARDPVGPAGPRPIATAERRYTGATREKVQADQRAQLEYVAKLRKELKDLQATQTAVNSAFGQTAVGNISNVLGGLRQENTKARITELQLLIKEAEDVLNLDPNRYQTEAQRQRASVAAITQVADGSGTGATGRTKKERESQLPLLQLELERAKELFAIDQQIASAQSSNNTVLVSTLELRKSLVEIQYQAKQIALEDIPAEERKAKLAALRIQYQKEILNSQLQLQIALQKEREEIQKNIEEKLKEYKNENKYQQRYYELVRNGIAPELAKIQVEVEKTFDIEKEKLQTQIEQYEAQKAATTLVIAELEAQSNLSEIDKLRLADLKERLRLLDEELKKRGLLQGQLPAAQQQATDAAQKAQAQKPLDVRYKELADEAQKALEKLQDPLYQLETIANSVSDAIGNAFKQLILGTGSLREVLAGVFQSIAESFADMVAKMITQWLVFKIITGIGDLFGLSTAGPDRATTSLPLIEKYSGANGGIAAGGWKPFPAFANGGMVTGPTLGLVGEGRYNEAIVPLPDGKSIPVDLQGSNGGGDINVVVNVDAKGSEVSGNEGQARALGSVISAAVQSELIKQKRPGGLLAR